MPSKKKCSTPELDSWRPVPHQNGLTTPSQSTADEIARRAYEIYLERGSAAGRDVDDWLEAERELNRAVASAQGR